MNLPGLGSLPSYEYPWILKLSLQLLLDILHLAEV